MFRFLTNFAQDILQKRGAHSFQTKFGVHWRESNVRCNLLAIYCSVACLRQWCGRQQNATLRRECALPPLAAREALVQAVQGVLECRGVPLDHKRARMELEDVSADASKARPRSGMRALVAQQAADAR